MSRCQLCGHVTRERDQRSILDQQRDHDPLTCQRRRLEAARAASPEGQAAARELHVYELRNAQHRQAYAARRDERQAS